MATNSDFQFQGVFGSLKPASPLLRYVRVDSIELFHPYLVTSAALPFARQTMGLRWIKTVNRRSVASTPPDPWAVSEPDPRLSLRAIAGLQGDLRFGIQETLVSALRGRILA